MPTRIACNCCNYCGLAGSGVQLVRPPADPDPGHRKQTVDPAPIPWLPIYLVHSCFDQTTSRVTTRSTESAEIEVLGRSRSRKRPLHEVFVKSRGWSQPRPGIRLPFVDVAICRSTMPLAQSFTSSAMSRKAVLRMGRIFWSCQPTRTTLHRSDRRPLTAGSGGHDTSRPTNPHQFTSRQINAISGILILRQDAAYPADRNA
jgi:hypothetical protein